MSSGRKAANGRSSIYRDDHGTWHGYVSFGFDGNTRRRKHVQAATKRAVAEKVERLERQRAGGLAGGPSTTVGQWLSAWIDYRSTTARPSTMRGYRSDQVHIDRELGNVKLDRLTPAHIDGLWVGVLAAGAGPATCAHVRRTLSAALTAAVDRGQITRNPIRLSPPPRYDPEEVDPLTEAEARRVLTAAASDRNGVRWSVALALGLRQGEALGLRWEDIDMEGRQIRVRRQLQHLAWSHGCGGKCGRTPGRCPLRFGGGPVLAPVKSRAGRRQIAIPGPMFEQLRLHQIRQSGERMLAGSMWQGWDLVFADEEGAPIRSEADSRQWHRLLERAGVRQARLHDARHTAATLLLVQGVPTGVAMRILGHADPKMLSRYSHLVEQAQRDAADRMGAALWG